jgi:hypothetical protein
MQYFMKAAVLAAVLMAACPVMAQMQEGSASDDATRMTSGNTDWSAEDSYWRSHYASRPYYSSGHDYSNYRPAYQYGVNLYQQNSGKSYNELDEAQLSKGWDLAKSNSALSWSEAQPAVRDAYGHMAESRSASGNKGTSNNLSPSR